VLVAPWMGLFYEGERAEGKEAAASGRRSRKGGIRCRARLDADADVVGVVDVDAERRRWRILPWWAKWK
jgi:hypothetical protein